MFLKDFIKRVKDNQISKAEVCKYCLSRILWLSLVILCAIMVVGGEIICFFWFISIIFSALGNYDATELLMLIPCTITISALSAIILFTITFINNVRKG